MIYCSHCGAELHEGVPEGDDRTRKICGSCGVIHYENPRMVCGCLIEHEGQVLLCRRAIEPAVGQWTPPAGFLELGEGLQAAALRETWEEARAKPVITAPLAFLDLPHIGQSYALFRARLDTPEFAAGPESQEVQLFNPGDIPWDEVAFPVHVYALRFFLEDLEQGTVHVHYGSLLWSGSGDRFSAKNYELTDSLRCPVQRG